MDQSKFPTKGNLIQTKHILALARQGYTLLDQKLRALNHELTALKSEIAKKQTLFENSLKPAISALITANMEMGPSRVKSTAFNTPLDKSIQVNYRSIMGMKVPVITSLNLHTSSTPVYDLSGTTASLDEAYQRFNEVKKIMLSLAESAITIQRLEENIRKTSKRANALRYIVIPDCEERLKFIQSALEERERDGFARLKVGRKKHN